MKKLISIFLAILMVLAISAPVFAEENTTLTIGGEAGREYVGYKLLNLTTSLKDGHHHPEHADPDAHTDECYTTTSSPSCLSRFEKSILLLFTREGVPVLNLRVGTPKSLSDFARSVEANIPSGPPSYDTSPT